MKPRSVYRLIGLPVVVVLVHTSCSDDKRTTRTNRADSVQIADKAEPAPPDGIKTTRKDEAVESATWVYKNRVEAPDEAVTRRASLTSPTRLEFGFPYTGGSSVRLGLKSLDSNALVSLHVSNGAFNKSFQGGTIQIRFDAGPPVTYRYSAAQNGSATVIFLDQPGAIIRRLKSTRNVVVNLDFYNQGNRQFVFQTAGLRWPYPTQLP